MTIDIEILQFLHYHPLANRAEIMVGLTKAPSDSTMKRLLSAAVKEGNIETAGRGPATKYKLTPQAHVTMPLDLATYFDKDIDEREVQESFNFDLIRDVLPKVEIFTKEELEVLNAAQMEFEKNTEGMTELEYRKEMERLGVDLSWKSSQIEGNTYSLLETERLLKDKQTASGKTKEEAIMLLNHKDALDFVLDVPDYLKELSVHRIEDLKGHMKKRVAYA